MEGQYVMMPVKCIGKICEHCPDLKIETNVLDVSGIGTGEKYAVNLYCVNVARCTRIREMMEKEKI